MGYSESCSSKSCSSSKGYSKKYSTTSIDTAELAKLKRENAELKQKLLEAVKLLGGF